MGHRIHGLYTVDFTKPKFAWQSIVLMADSYGDAMLGGVQSQFLDRVEFEESKPGDVVVRIFARHGRVKLRPDYANTRLPTPKLLDYEIDFRLEVDALKVTPRTAGLAKLFGVGRE
jgi:hypothetical protein